MDTLQWRSGTDLDRYRADRETIRVLDWPEQADRDTVLRLDEDGLLWRGRRWVALPLVEMRIIAHFLEHGERVVSRPDLESAAWPGETRRPRSLDARLHRLRTRIAPLGLGIKSIRQRGFLFTVVES